MKKGLADPAKRRDTSLERPTDRRKCRVRAPATKSTARSFTRMTGPSLFLLKPTAQAIPMRRGVLEDLDRNLRPTNSIVFEKGSAAAAMS